MIYLARRVRVRLTLVQTVQPEAEAYTLHTIRLKFLSFAFAWGTYTPAPDRGPTRCGVERHEREEPLVPKH